MIRVHERQLDEVGRTLVLEQFEDEMVVHLHEFSARHAEIIGDDWLRRAIRLGIERAAVYGVINPGLLKSYVELMMMFGSAFDVDPLYPWAAEILRDPGPPDEVVRMKRLYEATLRYLHAVSAPQKQAGIQALRNLVQFLGEGVPPAALRDEQTAIDTLARIYPQRCAHLGEARLRQFVRLGPDAAARYDVATDQGIAVVTGLMFGIGWGVAEDPLWPWVGATLRDPANKSPERRAERLQKRTQIYLERALRHLEGKRADVVL
ncbi:hypothetical protein WMF45_23155 [Sorangium sp. So ce448]|uniref:hypothetical protein n=1 Tax=Sorangium sp. So ce448 TaxID=3133314 RepID=UPI003F628F9E